MKRIIASLFVFAALAAAANARTVSGTVTCDGHKVPGVIVTDGVNFVKARSNGHFQIAVSSDAEYLYIVTPAGYNPDFSSGTPVFYQKLRHGKGEYDFFLHKVQRRVGTDYTLLSISDPQMKTRAQYHAFMKKPFKDLQKTGRNYFRKGQVVGVALGDIGWDSIDLTYPLYKEGLKGLDFPIYPVIGNHDHNLRKKGIESREDYQEEFGPVNYAFWLGKDLVICVDNIIYDTNKVYVEGYAEDVLTFVRNLLKLIPAGTHIYLAQHSPAYKWRVDRYVEGAEKMFDLFNGYDVDMISGHTHIQNNFQYRDNIREHNAPSICGAWWATEWCRDGEPSGYEIFTSRRGKVEWFYHPIGYSDDFQVELLSVGESVKYPESVVANVWDYDDQWSVTWYQDGEPMGEMERVEDCSPVYRRQIADYYRKNGEATFRQPFENNHYFKADPRPGSKVTVVVRSRFGKEWKLEAK